ncbi:MAG TPA: hypothetical protein VMQ86_18460 [Bryobacteraceae bacterium]|jgi:hypothetical protein|nr:hypothetical protein [Bryobacteraceae bacterium]
MKKVLASTLGLVGLVAALGALAPGADTLHIVTQRDKPVYEILRRIQEVYHWRIAYEDGPFLAEQSLVPKASPTGRVMFGRPIRSVSFDLPPLVDNLAETKRSTMTAVFEACRRAGNSEQFRVFEDFGYINVVQAKIVGTDGRLEDFEPLLDTKVTLPRQRYLLYDLVSSIINQVSAARHIPIAMATIPTSLFLNVSTTEEASSEPARKILMRAFEAINGPRLSRGGSRLRLTWDLLYDDTEREYFFNVDGVDAEIEPPGPTAK